MISILYNLKSIFKTYKIEILFLILLCLAYVNIITSDYIFDMDYALVIDQLASVGSFSDYLNLKLKLLDVQPTRDFALVVITKLNKAFGHQLYGIANVLIWYFSVLFIRKILLHHTTKWRADLISAIILIHPMMSWVLSWPTAIKHILAVFFIVLASYCLLLYKERRGSGWTGLLSLFFYLLSVTSQPITVLWPLPAMIYLKPSSDRKAIPLMALLFLGCFFFTSINYWYYSTVYPIQMKVGKLNVFDNNDLALLILSYSRSFIQIFVPVRFASEYSPTTILNLFGLPIFLFISYQMKKRLMTRNFILFMAMTFFPLLIVYTKKTNIFVSDTYLIVSMIVLVCAPLLCFFKNDIFTNKLKVITIALVFVSVPKIMYETSLAINEFENARISYEREPNCKTAMGYALQLFFENKIKKFEDIAGASLGNGCAMIGGVSTTLTNQIYSYYIYSTNKLSSEKKLDMLKKVASPSVYIILMINRLAKSLGEPYIPIDEIINKSPPTQEERVDFMIKFIRDKEL